MLPDHPGAILGVCFHTVLAAANMGRFDEGSDRARASARDMFDQRARTLYENAHPLLQAKFPSVERMPYYNLHRERAALLAVFIASSRHGSVASDDVGTQAVQGQARVERQLASSDGLIVGRPDYVDRMAGVVVDYKTGLAAEGQSGAVTESEGRQLRLYAYLVSQTEGIEISKGAIVRGDGQRSEIAIRKSSVDSEASRAKGQLGVMNAAADVSKSFYDLASPSSDNCSMCPCIPLCEPFWRDAEPEWADSCGLHVQGRVTEINTASIQGFALVTLNVEVTGGTLRCSSVSLEQIPDTWLTTGGSVLPGVGDVVRVVHARQSMRDSEPAVVRADKTLTSLWIVP